MMKRSGAADLPLHNGHVPQWLAQRMARLGLAVTEVLWRNSERQRYYAG